MSGAKIIEGLKEAQAGDFASVTIDGDRWARVSDQEQIRRENALWREIQRLKKGIQKAGVSLDHGMSAAGVSEQLRDLLLNEACRADGSGWDG